MVHSTATETKQHNARVQTSENSLDVQNVCTGLETAPAPARRCQQFERLQHTYGNQAVLRMLNRSRPAQRKAGSQASGALLRAGLRIDEPGNAFEQEADRVAEAVMRMPDPIRSDVPVSRITSERSVQPKCASGGAEGECAVCREKREGTIQRAAALPGVVQESPPIVHEVLRSSGRPLDPATRAFMEPRFGHDFGDVRVHTEGRAPESARAVNARAYTVGNDIVFGLGQYEPHLSTGRQLLAHELVHVVQQRGNVEGPQPSPATPVITQQAGALARQAAPATPTPQQVIADADTRRIGTLLFVLSELGDVISAVQSGLAPNPYTATVPAIQNWLFVQPGDPNFLATVQAAQQLYLRNLALTPNLVYQSNTAVGVDPAGNACPPNFAYSRGGVGPIFVCDNLIAAGIGCQRDVMIHEHFHLLGLLLPGVQFPAGQPEPVATTTAQALGSPDSLAQMAAEIADGPHTPCCISGC